MANQIVVAGAVIAGPKVLVAQRNRPVELAGRWELPGGKVMRGETEPAALARELAEELGLDADAVVVGARLGGDVVGDGVVLRDGMTLRAYRVALTRGEPRPDDHRALRWVTAVELPGIDWVPADRVWLAELSELLTSAES